MDGATVREKIGSSPRKELSLEIHHLPDLVAARARSGRSYLEFQHSPDLSTGIYVLGAGAVDRQEPHGEDEIYYVISGRARITVGVDDAAVSPGDVVFVAAGVPHRFHGIVEDLQLLVVFGPARGSRAQR